MRLGVRGKLFLVSVAVIMLVGTISAIFLEGELRGWLRQETAERLEQQALLVREAFRLTATDDVAQIDALADRLGAAAGLRVSVIDTEGGVLGDSELTLEQLSTVGNHANRPEVRAALSDGTGHSTRHSSTLDTDMVYVAVRVDEGLAGVVRVAAPGKSVDASIENLRLLLGVAGLVGLAVALFMSGLASHFMSRTLRQLVESARTICRVRQISLEGPSDEIGLLRSSLVRMSDELERSVEALARERDRHEAVLEGMEGAVLVLDEEQNITLVNRFARSFLGPDKILVDRQLTEVLEIDGLKALVHNLTPDGPASLEFELGGTPTRHIEVHASRQRASRGTILVLHDVTNLRRLERIWRDFVANVSHELRTPVSIIRANAETLLDGALEDGEYAREFVAATLRNAERLSRLVADLLDLSRIEAGRYPLELQSLRLAAAVERVIDELTAATEGKGAVITNEVGPDFTVYADRSALDQILMNLLDNAVKYTPESGGHIRVQATSGPRGALVEISDNGTGIEPQHRTRIFERFYRVDPGRSREVGGTGLGLAIVKHLTQAMAGDVGVNPNEPNGTTFWVQLPISSPSAAHYVVADDSRAATSRSE